MKTGFIGICVGAVALIAATGVFAWTYYELKVAKKTPITQVQQIPTSSPQDSGVAALNERIAALERKIEELSASAAKTAPEPAIAEGEFKSAEEKTALVEARLKKMEERVEQVAASRNVPVESGVSESPVLKEQVKQAIGELREEGEKKKVAEEKEKYRNKLLQARNAITLGADKLDRTAAELGLTAQQLDDVRLVLIDWVDTQLRVIDTLSDKPTKEELEEKKKELDTQLDNDLQKVLSPEQMDVIHKKFPNGFVGFAIK